MKYLDKENIKKNDFTILRSRSILYPNSQIKGFEINSK